MKLHFSFLWLSRGWRSTTAVCLDGGLECLHLDERLEFRPHPKYWDVFSHVRIFAAVALWRLSFLRSGILCIWLSGIVRQSYDLCTLSKRTRRSSIWLNLICKLDAWDVWMGAINDAGVDAVPRTTISESIPDWCPVGFASVLDGLFGYDVDPLLCQLGFGFWFSLLTWRNLVLKRSFFWNFSQDAA